MMQLRHHDFEHFYAHSVLGKTSSNTSLSMLYLMLSLVGVNLISIVFLRHIG